MRILHTSDWHLGARLGRHDRLADQRTALVSVVGVAKREKPHLIIHSGDLFDGFHPAHAVLHLALGALGALARMAPTVVIAGNHDSCGLLRALEQATAPAYGERLQLVTAPRALAVETKCGTARIGCVPFVSAGRALRERSDENVRRAHAYAEHIGELTARLGAEVREAARAGDTVLHAAHLHTAGARPGNSERRVTIGDEYAADGADVPACEYAAFGHIHDQQPVPHAEAPARYAGSLIQLDFGESTSTKSCLLVETGRSGARIETVPIDSGRPLVDYEGGVDGLLELGEQGELHDAILRATVHSSRRLYDLSSRLVAVAPRVRLHELVNYVENDTAKDLREHDWEPVDSTEPIEKLWTKWRKTRTGSEREADETAAALFAEAVRNAEAPGTSRFGIDRLESEVERAADALSYARGGSGTPAAAMPAGATQAAGEEV